MNRTARSGMVLLACLTCFISLTGLTGCSSSGDTGNGTVTTSASAAPTAPVLDSNLPVDALPVIPAGKSEMVPCPYLDTQWVANTNGQRMIGQGIDARFNTPACVFWSFPDEPQATVIVRHMPTEQAAINVVDWAAPITTTEPVDENGWSGGRSGNPQGAVYAVQKGPVAVVVFSNQEQSLKAELIAKETIKNLNL